MASKFTSGPWSVMMQNVRKEGRAYGHGYMAPIQVGESSNAGNVLAIVYLGGDGAVYYDRDSVVANAHLIAAAPDLYAALENLVTKLVIDDEEGLIEYAEPIIAARLALAKAQGEATDAP